MTNFQVALFVGVIGLVPAMMVVAWLELFPRWVKRRKAKRRSRREVHPWAM